MDPLKHQKIKQVKFTAVDLETTGFSPKKHEIIEIGAVKVRNFHIRQRIFHSLVRPKRRIPGYLHKYVHHINNEMVSHAPSLKKIKRKFLRYIRGSAVVYHATNRYDFDFLKRWLGRHLKNYSFSTIRLSRILAHGNTRRHSLTRVSRRMKIPYHKKHRALSDATVTARILIKFLKQAYSQEKIRTWHDFLMLLNNERTLN